MIWSEDVSSIRPLISNQAVFSHWKLRLVRLKACPSSFVKKNTTTLGRKRTIQVSHVLSWPGMDKIRIHGGHPLNGSIKISGSKNSALPILAAALFTREPCTIRRVPDLTDTHYMLHIFNTFGAQA